MMPYCSFVICDSAYREPIDHSFRGDRATRAPIRFFLPVSAQEYTSLTIDHVPEYDILSCPMACSTFSIIKR